MVLHSSSLSFVTKQTGFERHISHSGKPTRRLPTSRKSLEGEGRGWEGRGPLSEERFPPPPQTPSLSLPRLLCLLNPYSQRSLRKVSLKGWVQRMKGRPFLSATGCHSGTHRRNFYGAAPGYGRHADIFSYRPARLRLPKAFLGNAVKFREGGKGKGGGCSAFPGKIPLLAPICKDSL